MLFIFVGILLGEFLMVIVGECGRVWESVGECDCKGDGLVLVWV